MSEDLKFRLRAMSLGVLPSDALAHGVDLSTLEADDRIRKRHFPANASPQSAEPGSANLLPLPRQVRFEGSLNSLPGSPAETRAWSESPRSALEGMSVDSCPPSPPSDNEFGSENESAPQPRPPARRQVAPASSQRPPSPSPAAATAPAPMRRQKTFKVSFAAPKAASSKHPDSPSSLETRAYDGQPASKGRRFSIWAGETVLPPENRPPADHEAGRNNSRGRRRNGVFSNRSGTVMSLKDLNQHEKTVNGLELMIAVLSLGGLGMAVLSYEVTRRRADAMPVRWITSVLTLLAIAVHCYRFFTDFVFKIYAFVEQNQKNTLLDDESDPYSFHNLSKMWVGSRFARLCAITLKMHPWYMFSFLSELLILSVHSPPMTFDTFWSVQASGQAASYTNETFILAFMCIRLYILPKVIRVYVANRYSGAMFWIVSKFSKATSDGKMTVWFAIKVLLHENAMLVLIVTLIILLAAGAYAMRLFELGIREFFFMDSIWVILLSVSTVGYGDIFPETDYGRFVLVLHQVAGIVVLSTLVAVLQSKLSLSNRENLLVSSVTRVSFKKIIQNASALVILRFYQYRKLALLQQTWFKKQSPVAGSGRRGRSSAMAINMSELSACRVRYKKSLANLKRVMQRNAQVLQEMAEGRQLDHLMEVAGGHVKHALLEAADIVKRETQQGEKLRAVAARVQNVKSCADNAQKHLNALLMAVAHWEVNSSRASAGHPAASGSTPLSSGSNRLIQLLLAESPYTSQGDSASASKTGAKDPQLSSVRSRPRTATNPFKYAAANASNAAHSVAAADAAIRALNGR